MGNTIDANRSDAARRAAGERQRRSEAAHEAARARNGFVKPFAPHGFANPFGGNWHTSPLRSHVQNLAGAQPCSNGGSLSVTINTPHKSEEKKHRKGFGIPGPFDEMAQKGLDFAGDVVKAGGRLALGSAEVLIDAGAKTVDFVGSVAGKAPAAVGDVLKFAAEKGLQLTGQARAAARGFVRDRIDDVFNVGDHINKLGVNDTYSLGGGVSAALGIDAGASGQVEVKRTQDGYTVSTELSAHVGAGLEVNGDLGLGGKAEFKFKTAEEAQKATLILAGVAAGATSPVLAPVLLPSGKEFNFLRNHLSSLDVTQSVAGKVDDKFGAGPVEAGAEAGAEINSTYRLEFDGGRPTALVRSSTFSVNAGADAALKLIEKPLGRVAGQKLSAALSQGADVEGAVTVESRLRLDSARPLPVAELLASPATVFASGAETSVKASFTLDGGDKGFTEEVGVSNLSAAEARQVATDLLHGRVGEAFDGLSLDPSASLSFFRDHGQSFKVDLSVANVGIDINGYAETRDVRQHFEVGA
jgi:hypothetical protein